VPARLDESAERLRVERQLTREFRRELCKHVLPDSLRRFAVLAMVIDVLFAGIDWLEVPQYFTIFLYLRLANVALLAGVYVWAARRYPVQSAHVVVLMTGLMMLALIAGNEGIVSKYTPGLILLFCGISVLIPLSAREVGQMALVLLAGFAALPLVTGPPVSAGQYVLALSFPAGSAFVAVGSAHLLHRLRFDEFVRRREVEQARALEKEYERQRSRFTANVHHELRTPLTLILAPVDAMLGGSTGSLSPAVTGYLEIIRNNGRRLLKLINNLLDSAKIESKQLKLQMQPVSVGRMLREVQTAVSGLAERKRIAVTADVAEDLPGIHADRDALDKILLNLVSNALKFTDAGGRIDMSVVAHGEGVLICVADTGIGLPRDQLERIFDRFAQVESAATRKYEGTGIGLSLVRELAELHGGHAWAESEGPGKGTQMYVALPPSHPDASAPESATEAVSESSTLSLQTAFESFATEVRLADGADRSIELEESVRRWEQSAEGEGHRGGSARRRRTSSESDVPGAESAAGLAGGGDAPEGETLRVEGSGGGASGAAGPGAAEVLICEDNADMRRLLHDLLSQEFRVRTARNGREGLEAVRRRAPCVVLTDMMMPEMTGLELCAELKADPRTRGVPVVMLTSRAESRMKVEGLETGADDYVTKPFQPRELLARIRALAKLHRAHTRGVATRCEAVEAGDGAGGGARRGRAEAAQRAAELVCAAAAEARRHAASARAALPALRSAAPAAAESASEPWSALERELSALAAAVDRFARLAAPAQGPAELDLNAAVGDALALCAALAPGIDIAREVAEPAPLVRCRPQEITALIVQMLERAVAAGKSTRRLCVRTSRTPTGAALELTSPAQSDDDTASAPDAFPAPGALEGAGAASPPATGDAACDAALQAFAGCLELLQNPSCVRVAARAATGGGGCVRLEITSSG
jgi:signal transduction histidine kinase